MLMQKKKSSLIIICLIFCFKSFGQFNDEKIKMFYISNLVDSIPDTLFERHSLRYKFLAGVHYEEIKNEKVIYPHRRYEVDRIRIKCRAKQLTKIDKSNFCQFENFLHLRSSSFDNTFLSKIREIVKSVSDTLSYDDLRLIKIENELDSLELLHQNSCIFFNTPIESLYHFKNKNRFKGEILLVCKKNMIKTKFKFGLKNRKYLKNLTNKELFILVLENCIGEFDFSIVFDNRTYSYKIIM